MAETFFVTGGTGYVAAWCIVDLLKRGYVVRVTVRDLKREGAVRAAVTKGCVEPGDKKATRLIGYQPRSAARDGGGMRRELVRDGSIESLTAGISHPEPRSLLMARLGGHPRRCTAKDGDPGRNRTSDPLLRRQLL